MKLNLTRVILTPVLLFFICNLAPAPNVIARVGDKKITMEALQQRIKSYPIPYQLVLQEKANKAKVLDQMIDENILVNEAKKQKVGNISQFQKQLISAHKQDLQADFNQSIIVKTPHNNGARNSLLMQNLLKQKIVVDDSEVQEFHKKNPHQVEQRHVGDILVKTESQADDIMVSLKNGADFASLAKKYSIDPSGKNGGDIGWFTKGQLVSQFEKSFFSMRKNGEVKLVTTQFGYHIIKLTDVKAHQRTALTPQASEEIRAMLLQQKQQELIEGYLSKLRKNTHITRDLAKVN